MGLNYAFVIQCPKISNVLLRIIAAAVQPMLNTVSIEFLFSIFLPGFLLQILFISDANYDCLRAPQCTPIANCSSSSQLLHLKGTENNMKKTSCWGMWWENSSR